MSQQYEGVVDTARNYYNSEDADNFYFHVWGGEDLHIGIYEKPEVTIREASRITVERMASRVSGPNGLSGDKKLIDVGAGYGGSARALAKMTGVYVSCVNISEKENERNKKMNKEQGLDHLIEVHDGSFEDIPHGNEQFEFAWSQDAILHSGNREKVLQEVYRVLKPGGEFVFTDPMQADDAKKEDLQPVLDRIHLETMGSFSFYTKTAEKIGFEVVGIEDLTENLVKHYSRVREELIKRKDELKGIVSEEYQERMKTGLENWVRAGNDGQLAWGIIHLKKRM